MQKTVLSIFILTVFSLILGSCTVEKRVHRKGYNVEWVKIRKDADIAGAPLKRHKKTDTGTLSAFAAPNPGAPERMTEVAVQPEVPVTRQPEETQVRLAKKAARKLATVAERVMKAEVKETAPSETSAVAPPLTSQKAKDSGGGSKILLGLLLMFFGLVIMLFVSPLLGFLLGVLGFVFFIVGCVRLANADVTKEPVMEDVVYQKNGNVLRGTIIEQVPNESVKIKTKDGNVFVIPMAEVEKITKEEVKPK